MSSELEGVITFDNLVIPNPETLGEKGPNVKVVGDVDAFLSPNAEGRFYQARSISEISSRAVAAGEQFLNCCAKL